ncbi:MAG: HD domain-containing protein, partial [Erysipelotrichaceae bacterium]|nr:HD domain-containing protein [Erysipelotrichaceae bacterium]
AAVLHDTVEDAGILIDDIKKEFNERVAKLVATETEDKREGLDKASTWQVRKEEAIKAVRSSDDIGAKMVCLADKVSNLRSFHMGLLDEGDDFWNRFNQKDPKRHYWYYRELKDALAELKDQAVYKEYCFLIDTIFNRYIEEN